MRLPAILMLAAAAGGAAEAPGIKPRAELTDYPARHEAGAAAIGAELLAPDEVRARFVSELNRGYVVVEVAVYPRGEVDLNHDDFILRVCGSQVLRPVGARTIAGVLQKSAPEPGGVDLYPTVGVGYGTGPGYYDPVTGTRRGGGWNTSVGVGVGVGGSGQRPASTDADRKTMELELSEKALPEGAAAKPVAGYLYFPAPARKNGKTVTCDLEYNPARGERQVLTLPQLGR
jgi:hypothetical protein